MVDITIYVEGGVAPDAAIDVAVATIDMSNALRESFYKLFSSAFDKRQPMPFNLIVEMGGGEQNATELFLRGIQQGKNAVLLIDVYKSKTKQDKITYLEQELNKLRQSPSYKYKGTDLESIQDHQNRVFFMVREMEAWFLSQLEAIEACAQQQGWVRKNTSKTLAEDSGVKGKVIREIHHPFKTLNTLIQRNYGRKLNPKAKQKYGKLKHSAALVENLNLNKLKQDFTEVDQLMDYLTVKK